MTYASWIALASRSFPRRWRNDRGQELIETATDLAPVGATRPSLRILADVVLGGLHERRRTRPPMWHWVKYVVNSKLPPQWHPWMRDDLSGRWYWLRTSVRQTLAISAAVLGWIVYLETRTDQGWRHDDPSIGFYTTVTFMNLYGPLLLAIAFTFANGAISSNMMRRKIWTSNGYLPDGTWAPPYYAFQPALSDGSISPEQAGL